MRQTELRLKKQEREAVQEFSVTLKMYHVPWRQVRCRVGIDTRTHRPKLIRESPENSSGDVEEHMTKGIACLMWLVAGTVAMAPIVPLVQ